MWPSQESLLHVSEVMLHHVTTGSGPHSRGGNQPSPPSGRVSKNLHTHILNMLNRFPSPAIGLSIPSLVMVSCSARAHLVDQVLFPGCHLMMVNLSHTLLSQMKIHIVSTVSSPKCL